MHVQKLYNRSLDKLNAREQHDLRRLTTYPDVFAKNANDIGCTRWVKHDVDTGEELPYASVREECAMNSAPCFRTPSPTYTLKVGSVAQRVGKQRRSGAKEAN